MLGQPGHAVDAGVPYPYEAGPGGTRVTGCGSAHFRPGFHWVMDPSGHKRPSGGFIAQRQTGPLVPLACAPCTADRVAR